MVDYRAIFKDSLTKYKNNSKWDHGDFREIKTVSNSDVGSVGQDFIECLCSAYEIEHAPPQKEDGSIKKQSSWDLEVNGIKFELKTASEDVSGSFQFNHIRYHRPYEALLCLGV